MFWRLFSGQSPAVVGRCGADVHGQKSRDRPSCSISLPNQQRPTVHHHPSRRHSPRNQSLKSSPVCCHHVDRSTITQIPPKLDMAISLLFTCHTTHCLATRESRVESRVHVLPRLPFLIIFLGHCDAKVSHCRILFGNLRQSHHNSPRTLSRPSISTKGNLSQGHRQEYPWIKCLPV